MAAQHRGGVGGVVGDGGRRRAVRARGGTAVPGPGPGDDAHAALERRTLEDAERDGALRGAPVEQQRQPIGRADRKHLEDATVRCRDVGDLVAGRGDPADAHEDRSTTASQSRSSAALAGTSGSGASTARASSAQRSTSARADSIAGCCAQQLERLGVLVVVVQRPGQQLAQPGVGRVGRAQRVEHRQRRHALAQVGARRLAGLGRVAARRRAGRRRAGTRRRSARRTASARPRSARRRPTASRRTGRTSRSASRSCRRARPGSGRAGPGPSTGPTVSRICPVTSRSNVRAWIRTASGPRSASRSEARANRKSPVRIATVLSQRAFADGGAAAQRRLVHHVVVVQRREVGELDDDRGRDDAGRRRVAEVGGEQHQQRAEPLAAGLDQVAGRLGDERVRALDGVARAAARRAASSATQLRLEHGVAEPAAEHAHGAHAAPTSGRPTRGRPGRAAAAGRRRARG